MEFSSTQSVGSGSYAIFGPFSLTEGQNASDGDAVAVGLSNGGPSALSEFIVDVQDHPNDEFYPLLSGSDYGTATTIMPFASTNSPATLANGNTSHFHLRIPQAIAIRFRAKSAGTSALSLYMNSAR